MKLNVKTIIILLFLIVIAFSSIYNISTIYAAQVSGTDGGGGGGNSPEKKNNCGGSTDYPQPEGGGGEACDYSDCGIRHVRDEEYISLEEDIYDSDNNYIGKALEIKDNFRFVAGRFIGIDAYEEYRKTIYVTINPVCRESYEVEHCEESCCSCGGEESCSTSCWTEILCRDCSISIESCRGEADGLLNSLAQNVDTSESFDAKRQDVNNIKDGLDKSGNANIEINLSQKDIDPGHSEPSDRSSSTVWQTVIVKYTYNLPNALIDPKTGIVKYENEISDEDKYIKVPEHTIIRESGEEVVLGHYFIPLNAKSTDVIQYNLVPIVSKTPISPALCVAYMDKFKEKTKEGNYWADIIGNSGDGELLSKTMTWKEARKKVSIEGCKFSLFVSFKIAQKFYGEEINGNNTLLSGYNFYYRPIDYMRPFANEVSKIAPIVVSDDSFWKEIYNPNNNTVTVTDVSKIDPIVTKINDSFNKETYRTNDDYNVNTIRNYNEGKIYSSFQDMYKDGSSKFISGNNGLEAVGCNTYYVLGCGPANSDWEECAKWKKECRS